MNWLVDWEGYCTVFLVRGRLIGIEPSRDMREYMDSIRFNHGHLMDHEMDLLFLETQVSHAL